MPLAVPTSTCGAGRYGRFGSNINLEETPA